MRCEVEAGGDAGPGEHLLVVATGEQGGAGHFAEIAVLFHEHGGVHELKAHGEGEIIIDGKSMKTHALECKKIMAYIPDNPDLYEI